MLEHYNRRNLFIRGLALTGAFFMRDMEAKALSLDKDGSNNLNNYTILFQGDSITDGNRSRNTDWNHVLGHGYQFIVASKMMYDSPKKNYQFYNRGISGNKISDLLLRWDEDTMALKPDILSILIGVNDLEAFIHGDHNSSAEKFEVSYRALLQKTLDGLPTIKFVLCEPFILPIGRVKDKWEIYHAEISKRQKIVKKLAEEFKAVFVPFQTEFNKSLKKAAPEYWIWDGIHPMPAGHELMARIWMNKFTK